MALSTARRLATRISSCISGRSVGTSVPRRTIEQIEYECNKNNTIYLCFNEWTRHLNRVVVRSFQIDHGYSTDGFSDSHIDIDDFKVVASKRPQATPILNPWTRLGDKILLHSGGQRISFLDTYKRLLKFENSSRRKASIKSFQNDKFKISWGEIDGKLYCIAKISINCEETPRRSNIFEVLEPEDNTDWRPLADPPNFEYASDHRALFLKESRKIICWDRDCYGAYCFDVEAPETGWKKVNYDIRPHGARPFAIHHRNHPELGDFNLLFSYDPLGKDPLLAFPFYMSNDCEFFKAIRKSPIQLPESSYHYLPGHRDGFQTHYHSERAERERMYNEYSAQPFEFVNLGDERFGFILHKYPYRGPDPGFEEDPELKGGTGGILYLTYEYDIRKVDNDLEFCTSLLSIQHLRYCPKVRASDVSLAAAFFV